MDFITLLDGIVIVVVLVSALLAMYRGFMREVFSIASWAAAAAAAYYLYKPVLPYAKQYITNDSVALGVSAGAIFVVTLFIVSYITMKISDFVLDSAFGALDRSAGFVFGAARGLLLLVVAMLFFNWFVTATNQPRWVANAKSKPILDYLGQRLVAVLPEDIEKTIFNFRKWNRDENTPQEPDVVPQQRTEATPGYKTGERKSLDQLITGTVRQ
jgi:membrane protein required for colicin V production